MRMGAHRRGRLARRLGRRDRRGGTLVSWSCAGDRPVAADLHSPPDKRTRVRCLKARHRQARQGDFDPAQIAPLKILPACTTTPASAVGDGTRVHRPWSLREGAAIALAGGLWLRRAKVMDRHRLEVVGAAAQRTAFVALGCFVEIIAYTASGVRARTAPAAGADGDPRQMAGADPALPARRDGPARGFGRTNPRPRPAVKGEGEGWLGRVRSERLSKGSVPCPTPAGPTHASRP